MSIAKIHRLQIRETAPVDGPVVPELMKSGQRGAFVNTERVEHWNGFAEPVAGPHHRMSEPIGRRGKLERHDRLIEVKIGQVWWRRPDVVFPVGRIMMWDDIAQHALRDEG